MKEKHFLNFKFTSTNRCSLDLVTIKSYTYGNGVNTRRAEPSDRKQSVFSLQGGRGDWFSGQDGVISRRVTIFIDMDQIAEK